MENAPSHHVKQEYCETRPNYRRGRKKTSVRVFTINTESRFLVVTEIPGPSLESDVIKLFSAFGTLNHARQLIDYPQEEFVKTYLVEFQDIQAAKTAKKFTDEKYFYGGTLHVCYAPEYESVNDVRDKILRRRQSVTVRVKVLEKESKQLIKNKHHKNSAITNSAAAKQTDSQHQIKPDCNVHAVEDNNDNAMTTTESNVVQAVSKPPENAIPCNRFGIPLYLPPPPPPQDLPMLKNQRLLNPTSTIRHSQTHPLSKSLKIVSKAKDQRKTSLKTRSGYFHQKTVAALEASRIIGPTGLHAESGPIVKKVNMNFTPPSFVPRNVDKKSFNEANNT